MNDDTAPDIGWGFRSLARSSQIILISLTLLLAVLAGFMFRTIETQRDARARVFEEVEAILSLHGILEAMVDAETGERGFLLNGDQRFLEPLNASLDKLRAARAKAERYIAQTRYRPETQSLARLDRLITERRALIDQNIALLKSGRRDEAIAPQRSAEGKAVMDALRAEITRLETVEQAQRMGAIAKAERSEAMMAPLLALLGVLILALVLFAVLLERRHSILSARAQQAEALREAHFRAELLARELNHRVKNIFAVILAIVSLTGRRREADRGTMNELRARIHALSIAHAASQGQVGSETADLREVVRRVLEPYATAHGESLLLEGPAVHLPVRMITPIGMIIHELATNAAKYGAFSVRDGSIRIVWNLTEVTGEEKEISLFWIESGGPTLKPSGGAEFTSGFGSTMLDLAARQLGGTLDRQWNSSGVEVRLTFPLKE